MHTELEYKSANRIHQRKILEIDGIVKLKQTVEMNISVSYFFCNMWVGVCVGFEMCGCVYVWVL
jgi:hypothetical protein